MIFPLLPRANYRQITLKNSRFLHIKCRIETFLDLHNLFTQDPGCKPAVQNETWSARQFGLVRNQFHLAP